eukprot:453147-Rhodomonas_salina.2
MTKRGSSGGMLDLDFFRINGCSVDGDHKGACAYNVHGVSCGARRQRCSCQLACRLEATEAHCVRVTSERVRSEIMRSESG